MSPSIPNTPGKPLNQDGIGDNMHYFRENKKTIFLLVAPGFAFFLMAVLFPIGLSVYYALTDWSGIGGFNYIGFRNFQRVLQDRIFWHSLKNAATLALMTITIQHPIAFLFAVLIDRLGGKLEKVFKTIFFIPCVIPVMVTSKMWVNIYNSQYGLLNKVLELIGLGFLKQQWLGDPKIVLYSLVLIMMWQGFGWAVLIYYAGVKSLPEEVFEAAKIDGANRCQTLFRITIPLMQPVIAVNVIWAVISSLKQMETIYLTTNGGPGNASQFLANYLYIKAFDAYEFAYGNAISVFFVVVCLLTTVVLNRLLTRKEYY